MAVLKRYDGSQWVTPVLRRYNGTTWECVTLERYTGSAWEVVETGCAGYYPAPTTADMLLWYDADTLALADGASVTTWTDASGHGRHATGGVPPTYKTNILNGHAVVRFSGTQWLDYSAGGDVTPGDRTFFAVAKNTDAVNGSVLMGHSSSTENYFALFTTSVAARLNDGTVVSSPTFADGQWRVMEYWGNGTNNRTAYDGNYGTLDATAGRQLNTRRLGYYDTSQYIFTGDVAEVIVFSRVLNSTELSQVRGYLASKYGLTVTP